MCSASREPATRSRATKSLAPMERIKGRARSLFFFFAKLVLLHRLGPNSTRKLANEPLVRDLNHFEQRLTGLLSKGESESGESVLCVQNCLFLIYPPLESRRCVQDLD